MNTRNFAFILRAVMRTTLALGGVLLSSGQTLINLGTQGRNADFTGQPYTRPMRTGTSLPATCTVGDMFFDIAAAAGKNLYACTATNTWTLESASGSGSSSGLQDPGSNGVVVRTAPNTTTAVPAPQGSIVGTSDTQTLTNKSIDASEINTGIFSVTQIPAFSGDITTTAGSTNTTLASVNANPGTFGDGSHTLQLTVDAKGRISSINQLAISGSGSIGYPGAGIPCSTGSAWCASFTAPSSTIVGISDTQTLTNKSIDASEINTGIFSATRMPAFSGDFTTSSGSTNATLASVNGNPGTYGDSSHSVQVAVDAKGRITSISQSAISGGSGGIGYPGAGIPCSTGSAWCASFTAPTSTIVGISDTQTLTNKSIDASEINTGIFSATQIPAFTGDITTTAGSANTTLASVNGNPGTYGDSSHSVQLAVDAKGRITSVSQLAISGIGYPGAGIPCSTGSAWCASFTAPNSAIVGISDTQTLTNKSIDASEINTGIFSVAQMPVFSGDITTSAGSTNTTLASVNANPGTYGDSSHSVQFAVDAKGRITSVSQSAIGSSMVYPGAGISVSSGSGWLNSLTAPSSALVGISDTQTLTNKSIDASEINTGIFSATQIPAFTGDITTSAGSTNATLATIDQNPGTYGDASHTLQLTVDGKGRVTSVSQLPIGSSMVYPGAGITVSSGSGWLSSLTAPSSALVGISDSQTLTNKSIAASEINSGTLAAAQMPAFSGDITTASGSTTATLATVNENPGTYGDASHTLQLTVDAEGRITAIAQVAVSGSGGSGSSGTEMTSGPLSSMPAMCATGALYFATDQPAGQQIYSCSATDVWTQIVSLGGSGALAFTNGSLDIVTAVVPRLSAANVFTGSNTFSGETTFSQVKTGVANNTDLAGQLTLASGSASYTFSGQYTSAPICTASDTSAQDAVKVTTTATTLTIAGNGSDVINYICVGRN